MPNRTSRRLRRLILGSVITASSAVWTPLAASPSEARDGAVSRPVTRTSEAYERAITAVPGGGHGVGLGASLWRLAEAFALVEPARGFEPAGVFGSSGERGPSSGDGDAAVTGGNRQPPDWDSRDDASFDIVTSADLIRRELDELPSERVMDDNAADGSPAVATAGNRSAVSSGEATESESATDRVDEAGDDLVASETRAAPETEPPQAASTSSTQSRGLAGGGSPVIVTLDWADPHFGEEYCPYDCEGNAWIGSAWAESDRDEMSAEDAKGEHPVVSRTDPDVSTVAGAAADGERTEPAKALEDERIAKALEIGRGLAERAMALAGRFERALSPAVERASVDQALSPVVPLVVDSSPVVDSAGTGNAEASGHPRLAGIADVPRFDRPDSQRNCLFRGAWSPRLPLSVTDPVGAIGPNVVSAEPTSSDEESASADEVASPDVDESLKSFTGGVRQGWDWWSERSAEVHPTNWGPEIYGWAVRAEAAVSQATGRLVRRRNVPRRPKAFGAGARLLARAGAVEAAEAAPRPGPVVVAEKAIEAPTAEQIDQATSMLRKWWEMAESHGRAVRRVAGLGDADVQSR